MAVDDADVEVDEAGVDGDDLVGVYLLARVVCGRVGRGGGLGAELGRRAHLLRVDGRRGGPRGRRGRRGRRRLARRGLRLRRRARHRGADAARPPLLLPPRAGARRERRRQRQRDGQQGGDAARPD
ncbi:MAG: hypothetical protein LC795_06490 [Acidobacteria bacterium]|nr:hypothetical protein [Acidobacteriota bacterium]